MLMLKLLDKEGATLRGMEKDGQMVFSVYDFIHRACDHKDDGANSRKILERLRKTGGDFAPEIDGLCIMCKFPGQGQRETPCMSVRGLMVLLNILGGKVSRAFREESFKILQRYLDGDTTMCIEIENNREIGEARSYAQFAGKVLKKAESYAEREAQQLPAVTFVYGSQSEAFPNLIKIGKAAALDARLSSLNTSCAPAPYRYVAVAQSFDNSRDEAMAHAFFASKRKEGEFFEVTAEEVNSFFISHIIPQYQLELAHHIELMKGRAKAVEEDLEEEVMNEGENAVLQPPLQQAYKAALAQEPVAPVLEEICSVKKRERDDVLFELEVEERRQKLEESKQRLQISMEESKQRLQISMEESKVRLDKERVEILESRFNMASQAVVVIDQFKERKSIDNRTKMQFEDHIKNLFLQPQSLVTTTTVVNTTAASAASSAVAVDGQKNENISNSSSSGSQSSQQQTTTTKVVVNETAGLTVSVLAKEMGFKISDAEGKLIGKSMAKKYRAKYSEEPSKHLQSCNGATIMVNSYMQRDKAMMMEAINDIVAKRPAAAASGGAGNKKKTASPPPTTHNSAAICNHSYGGMQRPDDLTDEESDENSSDEDSE